MNQERILPFCAIKNRIDEECEFSGIDCEEHCFSPAHFKNYPHKISYKFNSRGFRDSEWPQDHLLSSAVWCLGDSFTVGIGVPYEHTWPYLLQQKLNQRTINVSMDGASNDWIARRAKQILDQLAPRNMVVMWSYVHRRENPDNSLADEDRLMFCDARRDSDSVDDRANLQVCRTQLQDTRSHVIEAAIPNFCVFASHETAKERDNVCGGILMIHQLDLARDGHHFDILTAEHFVQALLPRLY